jgi:outer membrane cobalamin receptor
MTVQLSGHNLLDQDYEDIVGYVGEDRQIKLGIRYEFE